MPCYAFRAHGGSKRFAVRHDLIQPLIVRRALFVRLRFPGTACQPRMDRPQRDGLVREALAGCACFAHSAASLSDAGRFVAIVEYASESERDTTPSSVCGQNHSILAHKLRSRSAQARASRCVASSPPRRGSRPDAVKRLQARRQEIPLVGSLGGAQTVKLNEASEARCGRLWLPVR